MDYDDNDYQNQHFQLGGEDNTNFLRPFSLPKFDLDEHLQEHLRFDSLGDSEDILGIRVQEGSNWIQDFSSETRGIEFSASAAEPCSISRQKNIWLEATSSESVEMLLKSVGEDDMLTNRNITESISDDVLNHENKVTATTLHEDDSTMDNAANEDSSLMCSSTVSGKDGATSVTVSHGNVVSQFSGDRNCSGKEVENLSEPLAIDEVLSVRQCDSSLLSTHQQGKTLEDVICNVSSFDDNSQGKLSDNNEVPDPYLNSRVPDDVASSLPEKGLDRMHLSNLQVDTVNMTTVDGVVSVVPSSQKANDDVTAPQAPDLLEAEKHDHRSSQIDTEIGHCQPGRHMILGNCSGPEIYIGLETETASSDLMNSCNNSLQPKESDGFLNVVADEGKLSNNDSDVLVSNAEQQHILQPSSEIGHSHSDRHAFDGCVTEEFRSNLAQVESIEIMNACAESVLSKETDGLLDVIVDGMKFSKKDSEVRNLEDDSLDENRIQMHDLFLLEKVEAAKGIALDEKPLESVNDFGGSEVEESLLAEKEKEDSGDCLEGSDKKQETPHFKAKISDVTSNVTELHTFKSIESSEAKLPDQTIAITKKTSDPEVDGHLNSLETVIDDYGKEDRKDDQSQDSSNIVTTSSLMVNPNSIEMCHAVSSVNEKDSVSSPRPDKSSGIYPVSGIMYSTCNDSIMREVTDQLPRVSNVLPVSTGEGREESIDEVKSDMIVEKCPVAEVVSVSLALKDLEQSTDVASASDAKNIEIGMPPTPELDSSFNDQNDANVSMQHGLEITPEDNKEVVPCNDYSSKNESQTGYSGDAKSECNQNVLKESIDLVDSAGCLDVCAREMPSISVPQLPGCAVIPSSLENSSDQSAAINIAELTQVEAQKDIADERSSEQTCPLLGCNATSRDISSVQAISVTGNVKESSSAEDKSFTFEVGRDHSEKDAVDKWKPFPNGRSSMFGSEASAVSGIEKCDFEQSKKGTPQEKEGIVREMQEHDTPVKGVPKEKSRSIASASGSKRKSAKEPQVSKRAADKSKKNVVSISSEGIQQHSSLEGSNVKPSCATVVQTSNLPDLNTAASGSSFFSQPFTDSQQVQLRAQILVYGYLIQGIPPEEACMTSAFGDNDCGRITWEGVWHAFSEKCRSQKSPIFRTPSRPVGKHQDQASTPYGPLQSRVSTPTCQTGNKSSTLLGSTMPVHSSIWSVPQDVSLSNTSKSSLVDPSRLLSPLHAYHSPHVRQYAVSGAPWLGQSPVSVSLLPTIQSSVLGMNTQVSTLRPGESAQLPHARELSAVHIPSTQFLPPGTFSSAGAAVTVSAIPAMQTDAVSPSPNKQTSGESKSRKKKKSNDSDIVKQMVISQPQLEPLSASGLSKPLGFSACNVSTKASSDSLVKNVLPIVSPTHFQILGTGQSDRVILSEETCTKVEQARQQAEDAAAFASAAVRHSEGVWSQLAFQRNSGLVSEVEQKLASAAVAAAAAASVAKAAAAAAKVAADAALQAKLITDEALASNKVVRALAGVEIGFPHRESITMNASLSTVSKHNDASSSSIISAAREGARKRVEAASAAAKRAENLDAIVKAAELAAGAVAQAGAIVAMGDPLPFTLNDILDAGPENYWKAQQSRIENVVKVHNDSGAEMTKDNATDQVQSSAHPNQFQMNTKEKSQPADSQPLVDNVMQSVQNLEGGVSVVASTMVPNDADHRDQLPTASNDLNIEEGSIVEVSSDENGVGLVWYSARVLDMKDGQAYVCYNTRLPDEGSGKLKEWVTLKAEGLKAPKIRVAHPLTTVKYEGTRKRRREVVASHSWNIGDKVDAWRRDGWWEGVITEKSNDDETKLTVCFSPDGESTIVRSWDLRPSLMWNCGTWLEWSQIKEKKILVKEGDTPKGKRQKLTGSRIKDLAQSEGSGLSKPLKSNGSNDLMKPDAHAPLNLSNKEQIFSLGKATGGENSPKKVKGTSLTKPGSRVVFGVPRPGKKRKFMDVSKHCVVDNREKAKEGSNSMKFTKYLMPQSTHGWKTVPKVDQRERRATDLKSRTSKSIKSQNILSKKLVDRDGSSTSMLAASCDGSSRGPFNVELSSSNLTDKKLDKKIHLEVSLSNNIQREDNSVLGRQLHTSSGVSSGNRLSSDAEAETVTKGKHSAAVEKSSQSDDSSLNLVDNDGKSSAFNEPRRSNRRIQPTSRLLEGLQSSLMISKIPGSHEKGSKSAHRGALATRGRPLRSRG